VGRAGLNEDFKDLLAALEEARVLYLVVGAHAMAVHGVPRADDWSVLRLAHRYQAATGWSKQRPVASCRTAS
jgi:hypothetical protein